MNPYSPALHSAATWDPSELSLWLALLCATVYLGMFLWAQRMGPTAHHPTRRAALRKRIRRALRVCAEERAYLTVKRLSLKDA